MKLQQLMNDIREWSDSTFGELQRNPAIAHHLKKEVGELIESIEDYNNRGTLSLYEFSEMRKKVIEEYADCFMLLLDSASHFDIDAEILIEATQEKLEVNKRREWGKPDENGVVEHIKKRTDCPECGSWYVGKYKNGYMICAKCDYKWLK